MHDLFHVYMYVCMDVFAHCLSNVVALRIFVCVSMWRQNNLVHVINAMGKSNPSMNTHIASNILCGGTHVKITRFEKKMRTTDVRHMLLLFLTPSFRILPQCFSTTQCFTSTLPVPTQGPVGQQCRACISGMSCQAPYTLCYAVLFCPVMM